MMISLAVSQEENGGDGKQRTTTTTTTTRTSTRLTPLRHPADPDDPHRIQILLVDVARAYFNASVDPDDPIYVELPPEYPMYGKMCGRLNRHLYGTRRAAAGWEDEYARTMVERLGFIRGIASGCLFFHPTRGIRCNVYGDDFTAIGSADQLDWYESELSKVYELKKRGRLGPGAKDLKQATLLNRVITWTDEGVELEADPRQAERLVKQLGVEGAKTLSTPGVKVAIQEIIGDKSLAPRRNTIFRAAGARSNFMGQYRPECQFATKECCRFMALPSEVAFKVLKIIGRFVEGRRRLVMRMPWQNVSAIDVYCDSVWAGCPRTRKSTPGGCVLLGKHMVKSWSSTQACISLSSGDAEHYSVVRAVAMGTGVQEFLRDLGIYLPLRVHTDSSAASGISKRVGLGTQRHIGTNTLWVQEGLRNTFFTLHKVLGTQNPADIFTKHLSNPDMMKCLGLLGAEFREGRPEAAPHVKMDEQMDAEDEMEYDPMDEDFRAEIGEDWNRDPGADDEEGEEEELGQHFLTELHELAAISPEENRMSQISKTSM